MGILLSWQNLLDAAGVDLSASSEAPGLGLRSILSPQIAEIWRTGPWGATTVTLDVDLKALLPFNLVALAAPRDGPLPGAGATVAVQASAQAAISAANLQPNPSSIVPGAGTYALAANATDLGAVPGPTGATGARRLGSTRSNGAGVFISRAARPSVVGGALYRISIWARSNAAAPTRGTLLTVDEFVAGGSTSQRRTSGPLMTGAVDGTWRKFTRTLSTLATTATIQIFFAEGWQQGAEIELADIEFTRIGDALDLPAQPLGLSPLGVWAWAQPAPVSARYLRLSFAGTAADAFLQLGRIWVGPALITERGVSYGHRAGATDPGSSARAGLSGLRVAQRGTAFRTTAFTAPSLSEAEALQIEAAARAAGTTGQVVVARDHTDLARSMMFGAFAPAAPAPERTLPARWRAEFSLEEDL